eukprot:3299679-Pleurochrysis_carterae.AAC.1
MRASCALTHTRCRNATTSSGFTHASQSQCSSQCAQARGGCDRAFRGAATAPLRRRHSSARSSQAAANDASAVLVKHSAFGALTMQTGCFAARAAAPGQRASSRSASSTRASRPSRAASAPSRASTLPPVMSEHRSARARASGAVVRSPPVAPRRSRSRSTAQAMRNAAWETHLCHRRRRRRRHRRRQC